MHFTSRIENKVEKEFLDRGCLAFLERLASLYPHQNFYDFVYRFTENSFINLYIQGLIKTFGLDEYNYFTELGVTKENNSNERLEAWGRVDLVVERIKSGHFFVVESKSFWSSPGEPDSKSWKPELTLKYYENVSNQAEEYTKTEHCLSIARIPLWD